MEQAKVKFEEPLDETLTHRELSRHMTPDEISSRHPDLPHYPRHSARQNSGTGKERLDKCSYQSCAVLTIKPHSGCELDDVGHEFSIVKHVVDFVVRNQSHCAAVAVRVTDLDCVKAKGDACTETDLLFY